MYVYRIHVCTYIIQIQSHISTHTHTHTIVCMYVQWYSLAPYRYQPLKENCFTRIQTFCIFLICFFFASQFLRLNNVCVAESLELLARYDKRYKDIRLGMKVLSLFIYVIHIFVCIARNVSQCWWFIYLFINLC